MKVGYFQFDPKFLDVKRNVKYVINKLKDVKADLIVLPELFNTGYSFNSINELIHVAEPLEGPTNKKLQKLAKEKDMAIVAGFPELDHNHIYNSAAFITKDTIDVYRKTHLFANERQLFSPGNSGFKVFTHKTTKIGVMVCFDWFFPEAARSLMLDGAQIIAHPSNLVLPYCPDSMKIRALENKLYTITANRIGEERNLTFIGSSQITDVYGNLIRRAPEADEELFITDIKPLKARDKNIGDNNILDSRKPEFYRL